MCSSSTSHSSAGTPGVDDGGRVGGLVVAVDDAQSEQELSDAGLIEADGYRQTDSGQQAKVYRLTAEGDRVVEQLGGGVVSDDIDALRDEVNRLRERVDAIEAELNEFRDAHNERADVVEELFDEVRGG